MGKLKESRGDKREELETKEPLLGAESEETLNIITDDPEYISRVDKYKKDKFKFSLFKEDKGESEEDKDVFAVIDSMVMTLMAFMSIVVVLGRIFIFTPYQVNGTSMNPTLSDGDRVLVSEGKEYTRGDIIVFKSPEDENVDFVKRVIGVSGDKVEITESKVKVNGEEVFNNDEYGETHTYNIDDELEVIVPEGHLFVLGDNRGNSKDSRIFGSIKKGIVKGKLMCVIYPFEEVNCHLK